MIVSAACARGNSMQNPVSSLNHLLRSELLGQLEDVCSQADHATGEELETLTPDLHELEKQIDSSRGRPSLFAILSDDGFIDYHEERLHSEILRRLLNPRSDEHALGDSFLRSVLEKISGSFRLNGAACKDPSLQGLRDTVVTPDRAIESAEERGRPDFYLRNEGLRFAVILENKVDITSDATNSRTTGKRRRKAPRASKSAEFFSRRRGANLIRQAAILTFHSRTAILPTCWRKP